MSPGRILLSFLLRGLLEAPGEAGVPGPALRRDPREEETLAVRLVFMGQDGLAASLG